MRLQMTWRVRHRTSQLHEARTANQTVERMAGPPRLRIRALLDSQPSFTFALARAMGERFGANPAKDDMFIAPEVPMIIPSPYQGRHGLAVA